MSTYSCSDFFPQPMYCLRHLGWVGCRAIGWMYWMGGWVDGGGVGPGWYVQYRGEDNHHGRLSSRMHRIHTGIYTLLYRADWPMSLLFRPAYILTYILYIHACMHLQATTRHDTIRYHTTTLQDYWGSPASQPASPTLAGTIMY